MKTSVKPLRCATAGGMRFYKLQSSDDTKLKITSIVIKEDKVFIELQADRGIGLALKSREFAPLTILSAGLFFVWISNRY